MTLSWTLGDIMSHATQALGNRGDISTSDASFWANEALRQVWDYLPHDAKEAIAVSSTTSGENRITFPTDFEELLHISNLSIEPAKAMRSMNYVEADSWTTEQGFPVGYVQYANWLELVPSPDSAYSIQIRYRKLCSTMTSAALAPSIATKFRYPVMLKAKQLMAENVIYDAARAADAQSQFLSYMNSLPSDRALRMREQHYLGVSIPSGTIPIDRNTSVW